MTVQSPKLTWLRDIVDVSEDSTDPRWTAIVDDLPVRTSGVCAMPAPGYAICWGFNSGVNGFLEVSFTAEEPTSELYGDGGTAVINELRWTSCFSAEDFAIIDPDHEGGVFSPQLSVFEETRDIVVVGVGDSIVVPHRMIHRGFSYGTTFGSLSVTTGIGETHFSNGFNRNGFVPCVLTPSSILWANTRLEQANPTLGYPARRTLYTGLSSPGLDDDADTNSTLHEPSLELLESGSLEGWGSINLFWKDASTAIAVSAIYYTSVDSYVGSFEVSWGGVLGPVTNVTADFDAFIYPGNDTLGHTTPAHRYRTSVDEEISTVVSGSWVDEGPTLEALEGLDGYGGDNSVQKIGSGELGTMLHAPGNVYRIWDASTGENTGAWSLFGDQTRMAQYGDVPAWLTYNGAGLLHLLTEVPPEPEPWDPDVYDDGSCVQALIDDEYQAYPDDVGNLALIGTTLSSYTSSVPVGDDYGPRGFYRFPYPCIAKPPTSGVPVVQDYPDDYHAAAGAVAAHGTLYWIDRKADDTSDPVPLRLREGEDGPVVLTITEIDMLSSATSIAWNQSDDAFYLFTVDMSISTDYPWSLRRVEYGSFTVTEVASGPDYQGFYPPNLAITPNGVIWWEGFYDAFTFEGYRGWATYDPSTDTFTPRAWQYFPYWGQYDRPRMNGGWTVAFIPRPDNSVWFFDQYSQTWYRLQSDGTMQRIHVLDGFLYGGMEDMAYSPDAETVVVKGYNSEATGSYLFQIGSCDPFDCASLVLAWVVGRVSWPIPT